MCNAGKSSEQARRTYSTELLNMHELDDDHIHTYTRIRARNGHQHSRTCDIYYRFRARRPKNIWSTTLTMMTTTTTEKSSFRASITYMGVKVYDANMECEKSTPIITLRRLKMDEKWFTSKFSIDNQLSIFFMIFMKDLHFLLKTWKLTMFLDFFQVTKFFLNIKRHFWKMIDKLQKHHNLSKISR